jgi:hypothetical protein
MRLFDLRLLQGPRVLPPPPPPKKKGGLWKYLIFGIHPPEQNGEKQTITEQYVNRMAMANISTSPILDMVPYYLVWKKKRVIHYRALKDSQCRWRHRCRRRRCRFRKWDMRRHSYRKTRSGTNLRRCPSGWKKSCNDLKNPDQDNPIIKLIYYKRSITRHNILPKYIILQYTYKSK